MRDVASRIRCGGMKYRKSIRVLCDKKIPLKMVLEKCYETVERSAIIYKSVSDN